MNFYTFQKENLSYNKVRFKFKYLIYFILFQILVSIFFITIISSVYDTPKERSLRTDNTYLLYQFSEVNQRIINAEAMLQEIKDNDSIIYKSIFDTTIVSKGFGIYYEGVTANQYSAIADSTNQRISALNQGLEKELYSLKSLVKTAASHQVMMTHLPAIQPIDNKDLKRTASGWGYRIHPILHIKKFHYGLDFAAPIGTPVYATGDGVVESTIPVTSVLSDGYGNVIVINHGYGYKTLYGHLTKFNVKARQKIKRGEVIGYVGSTGVSTGPHLHYEVFQNGTKVNPTFYLFMDLSPKEFQQIKDISNSMHQSLD